MCGSLRLVQPGVRFLYIGNIDVTLHRLLDYLNIFLADGGTKEINIRIARAPVKI